MSCKEITLKPLSRLSLYVHIPFCGEKCAYCDFYSVPRADTETMNRVLKAVREHFLFLYEKLNYPVLDTVYLGGGTPNILPLPLLENLIDFLYTESGAGREGRKPGEWTMEVNPDRLTAEQVAFMEESPVTRVSLGVQTFSRELADRIGRTAALTKTMQGLELLGAGFTKTVSLDLMTSIPGETAEQARADAVKAASLHPAHISCYTLTLEEGTPLHHRYSSFEENIEAWDASLAALAGLGYSRYEVSNFSRPGFESRHNLAYWHMLPYAGLGPGGVSTLPAVSPAAEGPVRFANPHDLDTYCAGEAAAWNSTAEIIDPRSFLFEYCMMGLRLLEGISLASFEDVFGRPPGYYFPRLLGSLDSAGYLEKSGSHFAVTPGGLEILNRILGDLLAELDESPLPETLNWPLPAQPH